MMNANDMTTTELMTQAIEWYKEARFELVKQIADFLEGIGFDRMEIMRDIRKGNVYIY
jgi:hypothetical protein